MCACCVALFTVLCGGEKNRRTDRWECVACPLYYMKVTNIQMDKQTGRCVNVVLRELLCCVEENNRQTGRRVHVACNLCSMKVTNIQSDKLTGTCMYVVCCDKSMRLKHAKRQFLGGGRMWRKIIYSCEITNIGDLEKIYRVNHAKGRQNKDETIKERVTNTYKSY